MWIVLSQRKTQQRWLFLLAENYFKLPRQTIRENTNFICPFPQDLKALNHLFDDHVGSDMTKEEFRQLYKTVWEKQHRFEIIDLSSKKTTANIEVTLTSFTYQIRLIFWLKMKNLLKHIVNNTEPKTSFSIVLIDNKTRFKTWFKPLIKLDKNKDYEIALIILETNYSFQTIDWSKNCFTYSPNLDPLWFNIILPEGSYHVEDINEFIQREMRKNDHYDKANDKNNIEISANTNR